MLHQLSLFGQQLLIKGRFYAHHAWAQMTQEGLSLNYGAYAASAIARALFGIYQNIIDVCRALCSRGPQSFMNFILVVQMHNVFLLMVLIPI